LATIRKRKTVSGEVRYQAIVELQGFDVERRTFERKALAVDWIQRREQELRRLRRNPATRGRGAYTVEQLIDRHLEDLKRDRKPAYAKRKQQLTWWREQLGSVKASDLTPAMIAERRDELLSGPAKRARGEPSGKGRRRTPATANRYLAALSKVLSDAVKQWHVLASNPALNVGRKREASGRLRYLTVQERDRLIEACRASELAALELIVMIALTTGMRRGEILGLRWPDLDRARGLIIIQKSKNQDRRSVPIDDTVKPLLDRHAPAQRIDAGLVFPHPQDPERPLPIDDAWQAALEAAEIENFRFHDLRHTAASYLAMSGATTAELAAVLGHKTLQMVKRYAHLSEQHTAGVVKRMTSKFFGQG